VQFLASNHVQVTIRSKYCSSLGVGEDPLTLFQKFCPSLLVSTSSNRRKWVEIRVKTPPLEGMVKYFKKRFNGD
jgi:hypothetical protein